MSSKNTTVPPGSTTIDASSLINQVEALFTDGDAMRASGATNLATVRSARANVMQRVRAGLATKLGASAPEIASLDSSIAADISFAAALSAQGDLAAKPLIVAADDETVVHGFVRDATGKAAAGVKVTLAQPKGEPLATVITGKDGHFTLRARAAAKAELPTAIELRIHDQRHPAPVELDRGNGVVFTTVRLEA